MTKTANKLLRYWVERLGLSAWDIRIEIVESLSTSDAEAEVNINWQTETARIALLDPRAYARSNFIGEQNIERAIVHELLHIIFDPVEPHNTNTAEWKIFEQAIDRVAKALVRRAKSEAPSGRNAKRDKLPRSG